MGARRRLKSGLFFMAISIINLSGCLYLFSVEENVEEGASVQVLEQEEELELSQAENRSSWPELVTFNYTSALPKGKKFTKAKSPME